MQKKNPRKKPFANFALIFVVLLLLYFLNNIGSRKSTEEQVSELISKHKGAIVFLESGTEEDKPFQEALREIRTELKGNAGIITVRNRGKKEVSQPETANLLPALIILDAHGKEVHRFVGSLDRKVLDSLVHQLLTHHH